MQQISQNIILGIVAGLTMTIISLIISDFWKKRIYTMVRRAYI